MKKQFIKTQQAPAPIGPYNQAVLVNNFLYVSGQVGMDPKTGQLIKDDIRKETEMVMRNLSAILEAAAMDFSHVIKTSIFITNMQDFALINEVYGKAFDEADAPARETIQVAGLPKNANVEISMIAFKDN